MRLTVGEVLGEAWSLYTRHAGRMIAIAALVYGFLSLAQAAINSTGERWLIPVSLVVTIVGALWLQGALVGEVDDVRRGRTPRPLGEVFQRIEPRLWTLVGAGIVVAIGCVAGLTLFILPGLALITLWCLVTPVVVLERRGLMPSIARSQQLVLIAFWRVFAIVVVTVVFSTIIGAVLLALLSPLPPFFDVYVASVIANSVTIPFVVVAWTLTYFDLRDIKELRA